MDSCRNNTILNTKISIIAHNVIAKKTYFYFEWINIKILFNR